ncbi:MAG TPA: LamG domain-containing protein, partial [Gemmataceae bacterium]|nr:LamG domain-containing protein [Gemmataceae bacterium]
LKLHWGKADANPTSDGKAVFNASNGYLSVWHMSGPVKDEVGTLASVDTGTSPVAGVIGPARHLPGGKGIFGGDKIADYPTGASPHTTEVWFRPLTPNVNVVAWGNEHAQGKVVMGYRSPPHISMDCYFSDANVNGKKSIPLSEWVHVAHTYQKGNSRIYVNGVLDTVSTVRGSPLAIKSPARLWIGGWYGIYNFVGDIDEVRVSNVTRSADWIKLQYENQKPLQTLVGSVVRPGNDFGLTETDVTLTEASSRVFVAKAGGAQRVSWSVLRNGKETVVATDRLAYSFDAGRVVGNQTAVLRFKAVHPTETKTKEVRIKATDDIPEPEFTLKAPSAWDGRTRSRLSRSWPTWMRCGPRVQAS